ncbi:centrosome-associated protein CEP250-like isoform X1 [Strix aluco]|uniref:centrosome-associated protein CEP250-like isoform X1 n=1 Tax=Strix aluco TaxID=111821 RepID=UPI003DA53075
MRAREELELKESEWHSERELSDSYLRGERNRLLSLWRQVVTFHHHFLDMKTATDRDLSELKAEQMRLSGSVLVNCSRLNSGVQLWEPVSVGRPVLKDQAQQQAEQETSQKTWEVMHLQVKGDLEKKELQDRVTELSALLVQSQKQNEEKEKTVKTLNDTVEILEASLLEKEYEASLTKSVKEENLSLQKLIKDITEEPCEGRQTPPLQAQEESSSKTAAWAFTEQVLAELFDSPLHIICESNSSNDPTEREKRLFLSEKSTRFTWRWPTRVCLRPDQFGTLQAGERKNGPEITVVSTMSSFINFYSPPHLTV